MQLSKKEKIFSELFFTFSKLRFNFKILRKKITFIPDVFLHLRSPNYLVK